MWRRGKGKRRMEDETQSMTELTAFQEKKRGFERGRGAGRGGTPQKELLQRELADSKAGFTHEPMKMTPDLERPLADELKEEKKNKSVRRDRVCKHNFYANGLTPEELRTTLEDLGPTYVKIGQIMSSRTDAPEIARSGWRM